MIVGFEIQDLSRDHLVTKQPGYEAKACVWCLPGSSTGTFLCFLELERRSDRKSAEQFQIKQMHDLCKRNHTHIPMFSTREPGNKTVHKVEYVPYMESPVM